MHHQVKPAALCASQVRDSLGDVPAHKGKKRGRTIPRVEWWCEAATAAWLGSGLSHDEIAAKLADEFKYEVNGSGISRCLSGEVLTLKLAEHLSTMFGLPPPVIEPRSLEEAYALIGRQERERIRQQVGVLAAGVANAEKASQSVLVQPEDGNRPKRRRRRVE